MRRLQTFSEDCAELVAEGYRAGRMSRRDVLAGLAMLGIGPALGARPASAAVQDVVMATWGGDSQKAFQDAFVPVAQKSGVSIVLDNGGPSNGKIRAMVEARNVTWDLCDAGLGAIGELGPIGLLEPIDYAIVDKTQVDPAFAYTFGVCNYMSSFVLAWDGKQVQGQPTMADFLDLKKYPGKRAMRKSSTAMLEMVLMGDGVPREKVYPVDQARAFDKIRSIKDSLLFWETGTQSMDYLRNSDVAMAIIWNTRANVLKWESKGRIDYTFKDGLLMPACWVVPKGAPAGKGAMQAIAAMQDPAAQVALLKLLGNGPANPKARALETPELLAIDNGAPDNAAVQAKADAGWYRDFFGASEKAYVDLITSFS